MSAIQLGPLALPTAPLPWLVALVVALLFVPRLARRRAGVKAAAVAPGASEAAQDIAAVSPDLGAVLREAAERSVWWATAAGFAVARAVYVAIHWDAYGDSPWNIVDLRDGGWAPWPGLAAAALLLIGRAAGTPALRLPLAAGAVVAAAAGGLAWTAIGPPTRMPLPPLTVTDLQGQSATLDTLVRGRPAVINLWASWCGPCRVEMPALAAAAQAEPGVRFLFVNQGEDAATLQRYLQGQSFRLEGVWIDARSQLGPAIGSSGLPTTLFVDAQGQVVHRHMGLINDAAVRARLAELAR